MAIYMVKVTFTLHEDTVATLRRSAARLGKPQSAVVREAVAEHAKRLDRLSDDDRDRMLRVLQKLRSEPPTRSDAERRAELREIRLSRQAAGIHRSRRSR